MNWGGVEGSPSSETILKASALLSCVTGYYSQMAPNCMIDAVIKRNVCDCTVQCANGIARHENNS
jgi:hypothetical protein